MSGRDWTVRRFISVHVLLAFSFFIVGLEAPSQAQAIDTDLLKQFENMQGSDRRTSTRSPVNESREQGSGTLNRDEFEARMEMEEQEDEGPSALEIDYQRRASTFLEQFGYDLFDNNMFPQEAVTGRVADNYVLGVGDEIVVTFHGSTSGSQIVPVDREGRVLIEDLPPIDAAGRRFSEVRDDIRERTKSALIGTEAFVSVGALKMISVYVVGEVRNPGLHRLTGLSTVLDALNSAYGVKKTGSLRRIRVHGVGRTDEVDLYNLFAGGSGGSVTLQDGDRIVVPTIGTTAAVAGSVVRPGIYETSGSMTVDDLIKLAGGSVRPNGYSLLLNRLTEAGAQVIGQVENRKGRISGGDILRVYNRDFGQQGKVEIIGHVRSPGERSLAENPTLKDLLPSPQVLADYPYLLFGVVETTDPETYSRILKPFSPKKVVFGDANMKLRDEDKIVLFGRDDIEFLSSNITRRTVITGTYNVQEVVNPDAPGSSFELKVCQPLEQLAKIVNDTRSDRFAAAVRAVYIQLDATQSDLNSQLERQSEKRLEQLEALKTSKQEEFEQRRKAVTAKMEEETGASNDAERLVQALNGQDNPNCPAIYNKIRNLLPFTLEFVASIDGAVRQPGVYPIVQDTAVSALAAVASGTTENVDLSLVEVMKAMTGTQAGQTDYERSYVDARETALSEVAVNPGSGVRFNSRFLAQESGGVLLSGEFRRPGVYTIQRGEKLSDLIERAGGLTDLAYPYGAVFTRERVKRAQQEGLKRTERELNMGLATAALKQRELSAEVLLAAQQLAEKISTVETLGRVVIEADPRILEGRENQDIVLEPGDRLHIPKRPNYVLVLGDVLNPGALQFASGKDVKDYLAESGGIQKTADKGRLFVVFPNGVAKPVKTSSWGGSSNVMIPPGASIVVPKDVEPIDTLMLVKDLTSIFSQLAVSAASIAVITR